MSTNKLEETMSRYTLRPSAYLLALLSAIPAIGHAAESPVIASVTSSLSNFRIELIDLAPNDGIAPSLTINGRVFQGSSLSIVDADGNYLQTPVYSNSLLPSTTLNSTTDNGATAVTMSPTGIEIKSQITYANLMSNSYESSDGAYALSAPLGFGDGVSLSSPDDTFSTQPSYSLSAHTIAVLRGTLSTAWALDTQALASQIDPKYTSWSVKLSGGPWIALGLGHDTPVLDAFGNIQGDTQHVASSSLGLPTDISINFPSQSEGDHPITSNQVRTDIVFSMANPDDQVQTGTAQFDTYTNTEIMLTANGDLVPSIPEPGSYALMGLGLVGISLVRRRQRR
jgi:hypothetical protein